MKGRWGATYIDICYCSAHIRADQGNAAQEARLC